MILTAHILIGAAISAKFKDPLVIFLLGLCSHFVLDAIPHWEYPLTYKGHIDFDKKNLKNELRRLKKQKTRIVYFYRIATDLPFGILLAYFSILFFTLTPPNLFLFAIGVFGALLPDGISLLYFNFDFPFLEKFQIFHFKVHHDEKINLFWGSIVNILLYIVFILLLII